MTHNVAILGASGYTGAECVRLIATHPTMKIQALCADRKAGLQMVEAFPHLRHLDLPVLQRIEDVDFSQIDLVFAALPHGPSQEIIKSLPKDLKIIDLSAGFRLRDPAAFEQWYGQPHAAPEMQGEAVYGLTEFYRDEIAKARLVAGTGCNAATGQFALRPLIEAAVIDLDDIIVDLKAGASGAGRSLKEHLLFSEMFENVKGYSLGSMHRHQAEFDQEFTKCAGRPVQIQITPHLIPATRGILITCYLKGDPDTVHQTLQNAYVNEPFVQVLPMGEAPMMKDVRGSNFCHIGVVGDRKPGRVTVIATLDNLTKGSSGQAVQNANLMLGEEETAGLMLVPMYP